MKIGMDLGGSGIRILFKNDKEEVYSVFSQPGNPFVNLKLFEFLRKRLNGKNAKILACAISGGESLNIKKRFKKELKTFSDKVFVFSDVEAVYYSFFGKENGIIVIAGTGSVIYGKNGLDSKLIGGLGYLLGDKGGGFWFGKECLKKGLTDMQLGKDTRFSEFTKNYFATNDYPEILRKIYSSRFPSKLIADFGASVLSSGFGFDFLEKGARKLAEDAYYTARILKINKPKIGFYGGVFAHSEFFRENFQKYISGFFKNVEFSVPLMKVEKAVIKMAEEKIEKEAN